MRKVIAGVGRSLWFVIAVPVIALTEIVVLLRWGHEKKNELTAEAVLLGTTPARVQHLKSQDYTSVIVVDL